MPEGDIQFELSDMEEDFNIGDLMGGMENFIQAQEERNPSGTSLAISKNRVPLASANPSLRPAIENAWQGNPAQSRSKSGILPVSMFLASSQYHSPSVSNSLR